MQQGTIIDSFVNTIQLNGIVVPHELSARKMGSLDNMLNKREYYFANNVNNAETTMFVNFKHLE